MKKHFAGLAFASVLALAGLTGCGGASLGIETGDTIYEGRLVYDKSAETPYDVFVRLDVEKKISEISCGRVTSSKGQFAYRDGILKITGEFLNSINAGEREIDITYTDETTDSIDAFFASKVIKTAEDFQNINNNLSGYYILNNDIDLTSISNFEPLGYYFEETSTRNSYFHGVLEGNGYTVKNANVYYSNNTDNNEDVYNGNGLFTSDAHKVGDNIGLFQVIGSSGVVKNVTFSNIKIRGRTIVGVIAGNNMGTIQDCIVMSDCRVAMGTHFYDNDCNAGGVVGINSGSGNIKNTISLTSNISLPNEFKDYDAKYIGMTNGNGWDHENNGTCNWWRFAGVYRKVGTSTDDEIDSNGHPTEGIYAFAGKTWGTITDSYAISFQRQAYQAPAARTVDFSQTHLASVKPTSGETDLGSLVNCSVKTAAELQAASLYSSYNSDIWNIVDGQNPSIKCPLYVTSVAE